MIYVTVINTTTFFVHKGFRSHNNFVSGWNTTHVSRKSCRINPNQMMTSKLLECLPFCVLCVRHSANGSWVWRLRLRLHYVTLHLLFEAQTEQNPTLSQSTHTVPLFAKPYTWKRVQTRFQKSWDTVQLWIKTECNDVEVSNFNILFRIQHRWHIKCLNWENVSF